MTNSISALSAGKAAYPIITTATAATNDFGPASTSPHKTSSAPPSVAPRQQAKRDATTLTTLTTSATPTSATPVPIQLSNEQMGKLQGFLDGTLPIGGDCEPFSNAQSNTAYHCVLHLGAGAKPQPPSPGMVTGVATLASLATLWFGSKLSGR